MTRLPSCLAACALAAFAAQGADLQFLKELVEIPSSSIDYPQVNRAMRAMKSYLEARGLFCSVETDGAGRELLFAATKPGKVQDYVLWCKEAEAYLLAHAPKVEIGEPKELVKERVIRLGT